MWFSTLNARPPNRDSFVTLVAVAGQLVQSRLEEAKILS
jgi:hypothetical protein